MSNWFKAGATSNTRKLPCTTSNVSLHGDDFGTTSEISDELESNLKDELSKQKQQIVQDIVNESQISIPIAVAENNECCKFFGSIVPYGSTSFTLNTELVIPAGNITVSLNLGYTVSHAGSDHTGNCNPPASCVNETLKVQLKVAYRGSFTITAGREIDLGPLGKFGARISFTLAANFEDVVECTLPCGESSE